LIVDVAGSAALLIALTVGCFGQGASDFTKNIDPLFAGVLAHPGNLGNTIQYAAASANRGDIESAISARVVHKERIHTSPTGSVQLLFVDQSTLNIAPNTKPCRSSFNRRSGRRNRRRRVR